MKYRARKEKLDARQARVDQQEVALDAIQAKLTAEAARVRSGGTCVTPAVRFGADSAPPLSCGLQIAELRKGVENKIQEAVVSVDAERAISRCSWQGGAHQIRNLSSHANGDVWCGLLCTASGLSARQR